MYYPSSENKGADQLHGYREADLRQVEEELYYPSSENKGADQLHGYREADLRLCFRIICYYADCWFSHGGAHIMVNIITKIIGTKLWNMPVYNYYICTFPYLQKQNILCNM